MAEDDESDDELFSWFSQAQLENIDEDDLCCPLFMSDEELNDPKNAEALAFIREAEYGGLSHLDIAEELKDKGNLVLKGGRIKEGAAETVREQPVDYI